jgi:hypothetical protein
MGDHKKILDLVLGGFEVVYKLLYISKIRMDDVECIQVHCDRFDIRYSKIYKLENAQFAVSKFLNLKIQYNISEYKHSEENYGIS